ncbi:uncharacterized protein AFUA_1G00770 [Aspergillus fumigatus Af293]|uniref:Uncharacterized protein n=2 Tax=Aspergillus fumigatus TaxID=746128 RepID=Q4WKZ1_ASPFU|nr:conserved hypothetical protein [Aspergillus fumigatus Af293]EAL87791.1 conserved hypothetical protein [Aspergillus fumigatus Af293]KAH1423307.1 hypothetical protein KXX32_007331 [Aspergillus fumigatus]
MAWYDVFVLWIWWCWERIRPFISTRRNGRNEDDLTSLTDKMPVFEDKIINTSVRYVNGEIVAYVVQTEYLDTQEVCTADTKPDNSCSNSMSDQSTAVDEDEAKALEEPERFTVRPSYIGSTGKRTVDFFYKVSLPLDDLEMRAKESRVPESSEDLIEALFHYQGADIWVYVPYSYAKARMVSSGPH